MLMRYSFLLLSCAAAAAAAAPLTIDPRTTVWVLDPVDVGQAARTPVALALRDLERDWYKVLGTRPRTFVPSTASEPRPDKFTGLALYFGRAARRLANASDPHPEAHAIAVTGANDIAMTGNSVRGEVYAIYAFAERVLNVEPLWWWTDTDPTYQGTLTFVDPQIDVAFESGAPTFTWRGFFPNDEDLLGNFRPDPLGQSMFDAQTWNRIAEALLRLKGNLVIAGTVSFPDESHYDVLRRRGVAVTMQHFTLLGVNTWRWPRGIPYSYDLNPEIQEFVWGACVDEYAGREAVWTIGYRGLNDYPFWNDEPKFNTTAGRAKLISSAMAKQAEIVRHTPGRETDPCVTYLWSEMLDLYLSGDLLVPGNTTLVFADEGGDGTFDPRVHDKLSPGDGAYYHVQMESPGKMSQLTEMVPPRTFFAQFAPFVSKAATSYAMINLSDLKPATFLVDTIMRYLWNPKPAMDVGPARAEQAAIETWCARHFGAGANASQFAMRSADVVQRYFAVDYIDGNATLQRYGDEHLSGLIRELLSGDVHPADALAFVKHPISQLETLYADAVALYEDMLSAGAPGAAFFQSSFLLFVATHHFGCQAVQATAQAVAARGNNVGASASSHSSYQVALDALASIREAQRDAEQLKWRGLYGADRLVDFANVACLLREASGVADAVCTLPNGQSYHQGTGSWSDWFTYADTADNFPYLNPPDTAKSMDWVVRIVCDHSDYDCADTPVGGNFKTSMWLSMSVRGAAVGASEIRYTLDGSEPSATSPLYAGPVLITNTTRVAARAFDSTHQQQMLPPQHPVLVTRPTFTRIDGAV